MLLAFGIGLPIDWALRIFAADHASGITRYITSTAVAFGLLAAVAAFYAHRTRAGWIGTPLAAVGRMALTCYSCRTCSPRSSSTTGASDWPRGSTRAP